MKVTQVREMMRKDSDDGLLGEMSDEALKMYAMVSAKAFCSCGEPISMILDYEYIKSKTKLDEAGINKGLGELGNRGIIAAHISYSMVDRLGEKK